MGKKKSALQAFYDLKAKWDKGDMLDELFNSQGFEFGGVAVLEYAIRLSDNKSEYFVIYAMEEYEDLEDFTFYDRQKLAHEKLVCGVPFDEIVDRACDKADTKLNRLWQIYSLMKEEDEHV